MGFYLAKDNPRAVVQAIENAARMLNAVAQMAECFVHKHHHRKETEEMNRDQDAANALADLQAASTRIATVVADLVAASSGSLDGAITAPAATSLLDGIAAVRDALNALPVTQAP